MRQSAWGLRTSILGVYIFGFRLLGFSIRLCLLAMCYQNLSTFLFKCMLYFRFVLITAWSTKLELGSFGIIFGIISCCDVLLEPSFFLYVVIKVWNTDSDP